MFVYRAVTNTLLHPLRAKLEHENHGDVDIPGLQDSCMKVLEVSDTTDPQVALTSALCLVCGIVYQLGLS